LALDLRLKPGGSSDLLYVRRAIDVEAARLAAQRATGENLGRIAAIESAYVRDWQHEDSRMSASRTFHRRIAQASHSAMLETVALMLLDEVTNPSLGSSTTSRSRSMMAPRHRSRASITRCWKLSAADQGPDPREADTQERHFYVAEVGDRGEVGIWRRAGDQWVDVLPWTPSAAVRPGGASNDLSVRAIGDRLTFLVNGSEVASQTGVGLGEGGVGVFVGGDFNQAALERLLVQAPT
jgi:FCD domain-containing protein